jgi:hypothetical protein
MAKTVSKKEEWLNQFNAFARKQLNITNELPSTAPSEAAEAYLGEAAPYVDAILKAAEQYKLEPELFKILERFLKLEDERNQDGSIDSHFLSYHLRMVNRLLKAWCKNMRSPRLEHTVNMLSGLNFNKPSAVEYFQRNMPSWVASKQIPNPNTKLLPEKDILGFNAFMEMLDRKGHEAFPAKARGYDEAAPSLEEFMKASVEVAN